MNASKPVLIISVEGMEFHAFHGVYEEERKFGNLFHVDVRVWVPINHATQNDQLSDTLNYEQLFSITKEVMLGESVQLLEHLCFKIQERIRLHAQEIQKIHIRIAKKNPPIEGKIDAVVVEWVD